MQIKSARREHLGEILEIMEQARSIMRETGNLTQWMGGYPSAEIIQSDIDANCGFICVESNEIVGYFCFMQGDDPDPNYAVIENGSWLNAEPYGVIHRLASGKKAKGIAMAAFDFAFSKIGNVRVDTHHENVPMQRFLSKIGFVCCGVIYVGDGSPRDAFQKKI